MTSIMDIEGIGESFAEKLKQAGVNTVEGLLETGATPEGRATLAEKTGIEVGLILQWVNHADLFRINGIGSEFADLLEAAGVDTVVELGQRNPENLMTALEKANVEHNLVRQLPNLDKVTGFVEQAKQLDRVVTY